MEQTNTEIETETDAPEDCAACQAKLEASQEYDEVNYGLAVHCPDCEKIAADFEASTSMLKSTKEIQVNIQREIKRYDPAIDKYVWGKALGWPQNLVRQQTQTDYKWQLHTLKGMPSKHRKQTITCSLYHSLTHTFGAPSYYVAHTPTKAMCRVNNDVFDHPAALAHIGGYVEMQLAIFDVDNHAQEDWIKANPGKKWAEQPEVVAWYEATLVKIKALQAAMPGMLAWRSKNGFRFMALLEQAIKIHNHDERKAFSRTYAAWVNYLARAWGLTTANKSTCDNLGDYGRYMRVPSHVDYPVLPFYGDPEWIGYWRPNILESDYPVVRQQLVRRSTTSSAKPTHGCLILQLLQNRGTPCHHKQGNTWEIECPDVARHSGKKTYDTKTYLYVDQGGLGSIHCFSDGCQHRKSNSLIWLDECFGGAGGDEVMQAEMDLGRIAQCIGTVKVPVLHPRIMGGSRAYNLILCGIPHDMDDWLNDYSRNHERDRAKTEGQFLHECICALKQANFTNEEIAGILMDPTYAISHTVLQKQNPLRFALLMTKNAEDAIASQSAKPSPADLLAFAKWFRKQAQFTDPLSVESWSAFRAGA